MTEKRRLKEMEFELALTGFLEDIYGLNVRAEGDPLARRRNGYATLVFHYHYARGGRDVKAVVSIQERPEASFSFTADFSTPQSIAESAEDCEDLAFSVQEFLEEQEMALSAASSGRRWDD